MRMEYMKGFIDKECSTCLNKLSQLKDFIENKDVGSFYIKLSQIEGSDKIHIESIGLK